MTENTLDIRRENTAKGGRYVTQLGDGPEAELTFQQVETSTILIDHTRVPDEYRGQGIAQKLVEHAIADARATNTKIVPVCSYVAAQFNRHPDWKDVLKS